MAADQKDAKATERAHSLHHVPWCEEYELMISGMAYRPWESAELERRRWSTKRLCRKYNQTDAEDEIDHANVHRAREQILTSLLGEVRGTPTPIIEPPFSVLYGSNTSIGKTFYGNAGLKIDDSAFVTIGDNVIIGPDVQLITINHSTNVEQRLGDVMYARPINIGDACWIGARVTILPGASIGQGCTIGAGAVVVSGHIPEYSVAVGVPARVVKRVSPAQ